MASTSWGCSTTSRAMSSGLQGVPSRPTCRSSNRRAFTWRSISRRRHCSVFLCRMCSSLGPTRCANEAPRVHHAARRRNRAGNPRHRVAGASTSITSLIICRPLLGRSIPEGRSRGHFFQRHEGFGKHLTAVDDKRLAGDVGCLLARKEGCPVRYFFCGSEPPHRDGRLHFRDVRRPKSAQSFGRYVPRQDGVDRHAERCELSTPPKVTIFEQQPLISVLQQAELNR